MSIIYSKFSNRFHGHIDIYLGQYVKFVGVVLCYF